MESVKKMGKHSENTAEKWLREYERLIFVVVRKRIPAETFSPEYAAQMVRETVQEVCIGMLNSIDVLCKLDEDARKRYICGIARHKAADTYKREIKSVNHTIPIEELIELPSEEQELAIEEVIGQTLLGAEVDDYLRQLKEEEQMIILLHYKDELSFGEIAAALGISENAVKMRMSRAKRRLAELMADTPAAQERSKRTNTETKKEVN